MANLQETPTWEAGIYQLETSDPVMGGENGIDNRAPRQLANRTLWLKNELVKQIGLVNQSIANANNTKADKAVQFTAGNGLTGGGTLQASRTVALGTPGQITATSTNGVTATSHTHAIDKASTTTQGIVQLNDTLVSTATNLAMTANQGKILNDKITATDAKADTKANQATTITAGNGLTGGGTLQASRTVALGTPGQITATSTNGVTATSHTHAIDKASTTTQGIVQLNDTLVSTATNLAMTANQGKILNDKITATDAKADTKANQATAIVAGNGLTGGGTLQASRTVALGTPGQITATSTNGVTTTSHTHAIDKASTTVAGVVQLNDTLTSTATNQALTANQGKALNDKIDNKDSLKTINYLNDKSSNYELTGFYRGNSQPLDGINTSSLEIHITHPAFPANAHARGIGFDYGSAGFGVYTHAWDSSGVHRGRKIILTEENGVMKSGDTMTGVLTLNNQRYPRIQLTSSNGPQALLLESDGTDGTHCLIIRPHTDGVVGGGNIACFNLPTVTGTKTLATEDGNIFTATKLQTPRTISLTGAVTGSVSFDGSGNVSLATTVQSVSDKVVVMTGVIDDGGTIPLPSDFTESQCKWMVSINNDNPTSRTWDIWEGGHVRHYGFKCFTIGRVVTAQTYLDGHNGPPRWIPAKANYIIIGVK